MVEISVVVPVYKEEANIRPFLDRLGKVLDKMGKSYEIIFALDPSPDRTEEIILQEINRNSCIKLMVFSRRFGQPAATMAGILSCKGNTCVAIDVDLQDQPELIEPMFAKLKEGYEVVYATRRSRKGEAWLKLKIAHMAYAILNRLSDVDIPRNTGDFRIMTRRVIEELRRLNETHGFLRGLVAYVGFKQTFIEYDRDERLTGRSKYNAITGSLKIGLNGLISSSSKPLTMMAISGLLLAFLSLLLLGGDLFQNLTGIHLIYGLSATVLAVSFFAGLQLFSLGLVGEYVGRIYDEVKGRPMYIVDRQINF